MPFVKHIVAPRDFPDCPGTYLMKDGRGRIIYVGKAKNLRKRVGSYFRPLQQLEPKTQCLMAQVKKVDYLCTGSEKEALLLENSLIKKHRPRYNIILRDDKSYILFKLDKSSDFPRLCLTRKVTRDGSVYYGPFPSAQAARETLRVANRIFALRKCRETAFKNRTRPCLQHQMRRCPAPCVLPVSKEEYSKQVEKLELFLSGRSKELILRLKQEMQAAAQELRFEKAAEFRDQIRAVNRTVEQQHVVQPQGGTFDLLGYVETEQGFALGLLFIRQGKVLGSRSFFWGQKPDYEELIRSFLLQFYSKERIIPGRLVLPVKLVDETVAEILSERSGRRTRVVAARTRTEKKLIAMAENNAWQVIAKSSDVPTPDRLAEVLGLQVPPRRIEAVDVSHLSGQGTMVGQVVFEEGRPFREAYRIYRFPELEGSFDDYAALAAWVPRRIASGPPWPDLVLIDGGKGQLAAVQKALQRHSLPEAERPAGEAVAGERFTGGLSWDLAAIAKAGRSRDQGGEDRIYRPNRKNPLPLKPGGDELLFFQNIRDHSHRFVLSRQKNIRKKKTVQGSFEELPGVGPKTAELLRSCFESPEKLYQASPEDLKKVPGIGPRKAEQIHEALKGEARSAEI
ncbi:MAG: excinuclease ABC subunit UvrC [Desulfohalobiaceae bacterium]|nr:excinuclease ABC subunit UvrC [Desulfohalobiaceae bacterium]